MNSELRDIKYTEVIRSIDSNNDNQTGEIHESATLKVFRYWMSKERHK